MKALLNILGELKPFRFRMAAAVLLAFATILSGVGLMSSSGALVSWAGLRPPILDMILLLVAVRFFGISRAVFRYTERLVAHGLTFRILEKLRASFYARIVPLAPSERVGVRSGDLLSRFVDDVDQLQEVFLKVISPMIVAAIFIVLTGGVLWLFSPALAALVSGLLFVNAVLLPVLVKYLNRDNARKLVRARGALSQFLSELIPGNADILQMGGAGQWKRDGQKLADDMAAIQKRREGVAAFETGVFSLVSHGSLLLSFVLLAPLVIDGELNGILLTAVVLGIFTAFEAVQGTGLVLDHIEQSKAAAQRVIGLAPGKAVPEAEDGVRRPEFPDLDPADCVVRFEDVSFSYGDNAVLKGLSFEIKPGERLFITGPSGSGKSTVGHLLLKWYEPERGAVLIGGRDIRAFSGAGVRRLFSVVGQHTRLFNTTLLENLSLARKDATEAEIIDVIRAVRLEEFLSSLPDGLHTQVGELGMRLSGGERQRVAIARALLKNAPVWILDEPDASLDAWTAKEIRDLLERFLRDKTTLYLAHRARGPGRVVRLGEDD